MRTNGSRVLRTAACLLLAAYASSAVGADDKSAAESREALERKLEQAQSRLSEAAREVAELSMSLSDGVVPPPLPPLPPTHGFLGIALSADPERHKDGVEIMSVSPGGAAAEAGLKPGDVLVEIDGKKLAREGGEEPHAKLLDHMRTVQPDQKVRIRYRRDGKTAAAELVARPVRNHMAAFGAVGPHARAMIARAPEFVDFAFVRADGVFGSAELVAMTPKLGQYFGTDKGLLVVRAPSDSRLKLEDGDVILDIDGRVPQSPSHAFQILSSYQGGEKLKLNVMRQKKRLTFDVVVPEGSVERREFRRALPHPGVPVGGGVPQGPAL
jgi:S1-C subfamily serine protease